MLAPPDLNKKKLRSETAITWDADSLYSPDAEKAVLGSMLTSPEVISEVVASIGKNDFFVPAHQDIFAAITEITDAGVIADLPTIHQFFVDRKLAEVVGSPGILAELWGGFATKLNIGAYVKIVKEKSLLRALHKACTDTLTRIFDTPSEVSEIIDEAETNVFAVSKGLSVSSQVDTSAEVDRALSIVDMLRNRKGQLNGIPTGFYELNQKTAGWQNGDMIVLAARPGVGKTALALTFARHALETKWNEEANDWAYPGFATGIFSLEMTAAQLMMRFLANYSSTSLQRIRRGEITDDERTGLQITGDGIKSLPWYMDDSSMLTINQLRGKARRMKEKHDIEFLIIDYLQLLTSESAKAKDNRQNEVAEISRGIKALAKELGIPILVLAQLNRKAEEGQKEPSLHNLRESGAIEQDADIVLLMHREHEEEKGEAQASPIKKLSLNIAKQRNGPTGKMDLLYHSDYTRFEDPLRHEAFRKPPTETTYS